jgi:hypothetical protein
MDQNTRATMAKGHGVSNVTELQKRSIVRWEETPPKDRQGGETEEASEDFQPLQDSTSSAPTDAPGVGGAATGGAGTGGKGTLGGKGGTAKAGSATSGGATGGDATGGSATGGLAGRIITADGDALGGGIVRFVPSFLTAGQ